MPESADSPPSLRRGAVAVIARGERLLVIRRSAHVRAPGAWCFPGGGIEPGESEAEALLRELREELACEVRPVAPLWRSTTPWGVALAWWHAELAADCEPVPNPAEVADCGWLTPDEIRALPELLPSNHEFLAAWERGEFVAPFGVPRLRGSS